MSHEVRAIDRAMAVLDCFSPEDRALTLAELSRRTGCPKSTLHRIMATLVRHHLVSYNAETQRYSPGYGLLRYQRLFTSSNSLIEAALPHLLELRNLSGETASLTLRFGLNRMYVEQVQSTQQVRMTMDIGLLLPISAGASGKAMLAFLPSDVLRQVLGAGLEPLSPHTITDSETLLQDIEAVRARGYAISLGERVADSSAVAAPILRGSENPVGAISIAGPRERFRPQDQSELIHALMRVTRTLSSGIYSAKVV